MKPPIDKKRTTRCELPARRPHHAGRWIASTAVVQRSTPIQRDGTPSQDRDLLVWFELRSAPRPISDDVSARELARIYRHHTSYHRLASLLEELQRGRIDWDMIHLEIQGELAQVWETISATTPNALSKAGRMGSKVFPIFSYRVFYRDTFEDDDPVIAGVNVKDEGGRFRVTADIGGEESGEILFRDEVQVPKAPWSLAVAIRRALHHIAIHQDLIEAELKRGG